MNDLRFALRQLTKSPAFALVAIASLGLGIAANLVVIGWIRAVLLETVPGAADPGRLVAVVMRNDWGIGETMSYPNLRDIGDATEAFEGTCASALESMHVRQGEKSWWAWTEMVTDNTFRLLGVKPVLGRADFPAGSDTRPGSAPEVILSESFWRRTFQADPGILGQTLQINRHPYTVVGVVEDRFKGTMPGLAFDLWVPLSMREQLGIGVPTDKRDWNSYHTLGRLKPGVSLARARTVLATLFDRLQREHPDQLSPKSSFAVMPMWECPFGAPKVFLPLLQTLGAASLLVMLLVVANLTNLVLARATVRQREMAVRLALGAGPGRLVRQILVENLVLSASGAALGLMLAAWGVRLLATFTPRTHLPITLEVGLSLPMAVGAAALAVFTGLLLGLVPALQAARAPLAGALHDGSRGTEGHVGRQWFRRALVSGQVALALMLLIASALCVRSFAAARRIPIGLDPSRVWTTAFHLESHGLDGAAATHFVREVRAELSGHPLVESVGFAENLPLGFEAGAGGDLEVPGEPTPPGEIRQSLLNRVSPGYFATVRTPLLEGREFDERDAAGAPSRIIINETAARRLFPGRHPLGLKVNIWGRTCEIVGVAAAGKYRLLNESPQLQVWVPQAQWGETDLVALVRTRGQPEAVASLVNAAVRKVAPEVKAYAAQRLEEYIAPAFLIPRTAAILISSLGLIALALALMGIYGVMSFLVSRRTREIGIRMALGAGRRDVLHLVVRHGFHLTGLGLVVGLPGAYAVTRLLGGFLLGVEPGDPPTFFLTAVILGAAGVAACWIPARRAARVDPMVALRSDG